MFLATSWKPEVWSRDGPHCKQKRGSDAGCHQGALYQRTHLFPADKVGRERRLLLAPLVWPNRVVIHVIWLLVIFTCGPGQSHQKPGSAETRDIRLPEYQPDWRLRDGAMGPHSALRAYICRHKDGRRAETASGQRPPTSAAPKNSPVHSRQSKGPLFEFTVPTRLKRSSSPPATSPATSTFGMPQSSSTCRGKFVEV
jgi:hypothetical protein